MRAMCRKGIVGHQEPQDQDHGPDRQDLADWDIAFFIIEKILDFLLHMRE